MNCPTCDSGDILYFIESDSSICDVCGKSFFNKISDREISPVPMGLTYAHWKQFFDLLTRCNSDQLRHMQRLVDNELLKRSGRLV